MFFIRESFLLFLLVGEMTLCYAMYAMLKMCATTPHSRINFLSAHA